MIIVEDGWGEGGGSGGPMMDVRKNLAEAGNLDRP
jgi:hypothetical protein